MDSAGRKQKPTSFFFPPSPFHAHTAKPFHPQMRAQVDPTALSGCFEILEAQVRLKSALQSSSHLKLLFPIIVLTQAQKRWSSGDV